MRFGISTHLYHGARLDRDHLARSRRTGSRRSRSSRRARTSTTTTRRRSTGWRGGWPRPGLALHARARADRPSASRRRLWAPTFSNARGRREPRAGGGARDGGGAASRAADSVRACWSCTSGTPTAQQPAAATTAATRPCAAWRRSAALAEPLGVRVALEVIPNQLSRRRRAACDCSSASSTLEHAGICLDFGHAHLIGDVVDAVETGVGARHRDARARQRRPRRRRTWCRSTGTHRLGRGADGDAEDRLRRART